MRVELKCACGAEAVFSSTTFINRGGSPDDKGHVYVVELRAKEWQEEHKHHATMKFTGTSHER